MAQDLFSSFDASFGLTKLDIATFAESNRFCAKTLYPRQRLLLKLFFLEELTDAEERVLDLWIQGGRGEIDISPHIRERMQYLRNQGAKHFREITLVGGRRSSKGFVTGIALAKIMYDAMNLQNPNEYYGIDKTKELYFMCMAASEQQAKELQYADFSSTVASCKAMQQNVTRLQEKEFTVATEADKQLMESWGDGRRLGRDISKLRGKALPANARTARGYAIMAASFDELGHWLHGESDQSDEAVFSAVRPALDQFGQDALQMNISSPYTKIGKLYERFMVGMAEENGVPSYPQTLSIRFPSWALYEGWWESDDYMGAKKCMQVSPDWDLNFKKEDGTDFYTIDDRIAINQARHEEQQQPDKFKIENRAEWAEVVDAYLDPRMVDRMFAGRPIEANGDVVRETLRTNWHDSTYEKEYRMHLDPASTTAAFALCLAHTEVLTINGRRSTHVVIDGIRRWLPEDFGGEVIDWHHVIEEVYHLIDIFRPREVSMDQFSKGAGIQMLKERVRHGDISETRVMEVTATQQHNWDTAEIFKTALYQDLIHAPDDTKDCHHAAQELKFLQEIRTGRIPRIEHPSEGPITSDDCFDAVSETVSGLIGNLVARQVRHEMTDMHLQIGASGGYGLEQHESRGQNPSHRMHQWYSGGQMGDQRGIAGNKGRSSGFYRKGQSPNPSRGFSRGRGRGRKRN